MFNFSGSSGANTASTPIGGASNCFTVSGISAPVFSSSGVNSTDVLSPAGSTCSSVSFHAALTTAPGAFTGLSGSLLIYRGATSLGNGGTVSVVDLCNFNPNAAGGAVGSALCSSTTAVTISAADQLAVCFRATFSTPPATKMAWNVRCLAP